MHKTILIPLIKKVGTFENVLYIKVEYLRNYLNTHVIANYLLLHVPWAYCKHKQKIKTKKKLA